jgi:hypothetical protein
VQTRIDNPENRAGKYDPGCIHFEAKEKDRASDGGQRCGEIEDRGTGQEKYNGQHQAQRARIHSIEKCRDAFGFSESRQ